MTTEGRPWPTDKRQRQTAESDLLVTKLQAPRVRSRLVHRDLLLAQLEAGLDCALTLICAPAGSGKTSLLVQGIQSLDYGKQNNRSRP